MNALSPTPQFDEGPDPGLQARLRERYKERLTQVTQGFADYVSDLVQRGDITPADSQKVLTDLRDPQVLVYLELWVALNLFDAVVRGDVITPLLYSSFGAAGAWLSEGVRALLRNGLVQTAGARLPMASRQTLAFVSMVPVVGDQVPLVFLLKNYPELGRLFRAYIRRQTFKGIRARLFGLGLMLGESNARENIEQLFGRQERARQPLRALQPAIKRESIEPPLAPEHPRALRRSLPAVRELEVAAL